ncbi:MAG: hypothetical protein IT206_09765 [Fimbriimonadaceae bacterium]|nr:hypothetical protein [Fimbriimonadaceae bacterium]
MFSRAICGTAVVLGLANLASAQYYLRNWVQINPLTPLINGATGTTTSTSKVVADDIYAPEYAGQRITALLIAYVNQNPQALNITSNVSVYAAEGAPSGPTGIAYPGSLLLHRSETATVASGDVRFPIWIHSTSTPINAFVPNGPMWVGASFSGPTGSELNQIGMYYLQGEPRSTSAIFQSTVGMIGNVSNPAGTQTSVVSPSGNISATVGIQSQTFRTNVIWATQPAAYHRRVQVTATVGGTKLLLDTTTTLPRTLTSQFLSWVVPAILPIGFGNPVTFSIDGESFLRRRVTGSVPVPAPATTGPIINLPPTTLIGGDCDDSGEIDAADIDFVIAKFGMTFAVAGGDSNADVDASGEVDAADIDLVITNFGLSDDF